MTKKIIGPSVPRILTSKYLHFHIVNCLHLIFGLNGSLAIFSVATSVKSRVTVGVAPTFRSASRAERRKEVT